MLSRDYRIFCYIFFLSCKKHDYFCSNQKQETTFLDNQLRKQRKKIRKRYLLTYIIYCVIIILTWDDIALSRPVIGVLKLQKGGIAMSDNVTKVFSFLCGLHLTLP